MVISCGTRNLVLSNEGNDISLWKRSTITGTFVGNLTRMAATSSFLVASGFFCLKDMNFFVLSFGSMCGILIVLGAKWVTNELTVRPGTFPKSFSPGLLRFGWQLWQCLATIIWITGTSLTKLLFTGFEEMYIIFYLCMNAQHTRTVEYRMYFTVCTTG